MTCHDLKTTLSSWMHEELECEDRGKDRFVLTLPLLKPNGDSIDLGVERLSDRWRISDMGNTHATLFLSGVDLTGVRGVEFKEIKQSFKIVESGRELFVESAPSQVGGAVFEFVHAIQSILSLQLTVAPRPQSHVLYRTRTAGGGESCIPSSGRRLRRHQILQARQTSLDQSSAD